MATQSRSIPVSKDLMHQAKIKYPGYDDQQALTLYMIDEFSKQHDTDSQQTRLINAQRSENEKLKGAIKSIGSELDQLERESVSNDNEIERLKQLTAKLRPASELTQQAAQVSAKEAARIEQELEKIKNKPGMDEKKFTALNDRVQKLLKNPNVDSKELAELEEIIRNLEKQNVITAKEYLDAQNKLEAKEKRFVKYIAKKGAEAEERTRVSSEELKKYAGIVDSYKQEIEGFNNYMSQVKQEIDDKMKEINLALPKIKRTALTKSPNAQDVAVKPRAISGPSRGPRGMDQLAAQAEKEYSMANIADQVPMNESLEQYKNVNSDFYWWGIKYTPVIVRMLHNRYSNIEKEYPSEQVIDQVHDLLPFLWDDDEDALITQEMMDNFLDVVANKLKKEGPRPIQKDFFGNTSLAEQYEHMLDKLIGLKYL